MKNCVILNENGAFYRLINSWTNNYENALQMTETGAKKIARKLERAQRVIKNYTTVNPDGITQGKTVLNLEEVTRCGRVYKSSPHYKLHDCNGGKYCNGSCKKSFFKKKTKVIR